MSRQATAWRTRIVTRFYENERTAQTISDREHWHFCREILRRALEGWSDPWVAAHYYTYGLHPTKYRQRVAEEKARQLWELHRKRDTPTTRQPSNTLAA